MARGKGPSGLFDQGLRDHTQVLGFDAELFGVPELGHSVLRVTAVYAVCHFVVDLACVSTLMGRVVPTLGSSVPAAPAIAVIVYDMVAFCLQLPIGALLDALGRRMSQRAALLSFALVALGVVCGCVPGLTCTAATVILVALGNALFHCVGGVEVLGESGGRMAPAGEFISTGALGLFVGGLAGFNGWWGMPALMLALLAGCSVLVVRVVGATSDADGTFVLTCTGRDWLAVALLAATVALRSYVGLTMAFPWKGSLALSTLAIVAVVAGKAFGGRVADTLGAPATSAISLGGTSLLFLPSWTSVPAGIAATFLFNFTMAITLGSLAQLLPRAKGMAFGIASFALAVGALPALMGFGVGSGIGLAALSLVSLVLLELALALGGMASDSVTTLLRDAPNLSRRPDGCTIPRQRAWRMRDVHPRQAQEPREAAAPDGPWVQRDA